MSGVIVPDYAVPDALMVPHYPPASLPLLEAVAIAAARHVGVILLSNHPAGTHAFIARQPDPERFSVVGADYDTPWIRDRSPIVVRESGGVRWVLPKMQDMKRGRDDALFETLSAVPTRPAPLVIAQGNLVAGPEGLAISTARVMTDNGFGDIAELAPAAAELGIGRWIVIPHFREEPSGHADVHVRLLAPDLAAVAWNAGDGGDRAVAEWVERELAASLPAARLLRIPLRRDGKRFASLVNWIQIGRELLIPRFEATPDADVVEARRVLEAEGFRCEFIASPTDELGGSLHCLTASIFV